MEVRLLICLFIASSCCSIAINKYVLWTLSFTYPTVFQSIQMITVVFIVFSLHLLGYLSIGGFKLEMLAWFPAVMFFTLSIYFGSKALAILPIPLFTLLQQVLTHTCLSGFSYYKQRVFPGLSVILSLITSWSCVLIVLIVDIAIWNYKWLIAHCVANALYSYYALYVNHMEITEINKMLMNAFFSIIILTIFGLKTGETWTILDFEHIKNVKFHVACLLSGIFGTVSLISYSKLCDVIPTKGIRLYHTFSMLIVSLLSYVTFQAFAVSIASVATLLGLFSILVQCCVLYGTDAFSCLETKQEIVVAKISKV